MQFTEKVPYFGTVVLLINTHSNEFFITSINSCDVKYTILTWWGHFIWYKFDMSHDFMFSGCCSSIANSIFRARGQRVRNSSSICFRLSHRRMFSRWNVLLPSDIDMYDLLCGISSHALHISSLRPHYNTKNSINIWRNNWIGIDNNNNKMIIWMRKMCVLRQSSHTNTHTHTHIIWLFLPFPSLWVFSLVKFST